MKRHLAKLAAVLVVGVAASGTAAAHDAFAVSIGVPGFGVGYSSPGVGYAYAAPAVVAAPPAAYYPTPYAYSYYYPARPVVYGPYVGYYGRYGRYRYWHR